MRAEVGARPVDKRRSPLARREKPGASRRARKGVLWALAAVAAALVATGVLFAGSPERIPAGVTVAGVDIGGLTAAQAEKVLAERAARYASVSVVFTAAGKRWAIPPERLDVRVDWGAVVAEARAAGAGPIPFRGLKRVKVRLFGVDLEPHADVYDAALEFQVARLAEEIRTPARDAAIELRGLRPVILPARAGRELDRGRAKTTIVAALAGFERARVPLPLRVDRPDVTESDLVPIAAQVRTALSGPVRFGYKGTHWRVRPAQLAKFLLLPANGSKELDVGGTEAERYFARLAHAVNRKPTDADFAVAADGSVNVVPATPGRALDIPATAKALLAAALSSRARDAELVVDAVEPKLTTEKARAMSIERVLASYSTAYAGTDDRIHNLRLAVSFLDETRIAPGATFSFNETVGPRTEERGFRLAPVIMDGEYEEGIGGGVSQVATTVFNAVWEAGLKITARAAHVLYISRYPAGRDATVNYPDLDLKFVNDTGGWLLMRASAGDSGIAVSLAGPDTGRRVVSEAGPLLEVAPPKVKKVRDPTLLKGEKVVEDEGEPRRAVTVTRTVYEGDEVLYREAWHTTYRSEPKIVRVGTMPKPLGEKPAKEAPAEPAPPADGAPPVQATTAPTETVPATAAPTG